MYVLVDMCTCVCSLWATRHHVRIYAVHTKTCSSLNIPICCIYTHTHIQYTPTTERNASRGDTTMGQYMLATHYWRRRSGVLRYFFHLNPSRVTHKYVLKCCAKPLCVLPHVPSIYKTALSNVDSYRIVSVCAPCDR